MTLHTPNEVSAARITVALSEWQHVGPDQIGGLRGLSFRDDKAAQRSVRDLDQRVLITEAYDGLHVEATSYVGRVDIGRLQIIVRPKIPNATITRLFRYAYGLRHLNLIEQASTPVARSSFEDLLIEMLCAEVAELLHRGLARRYVAHEADLTTIRGRILVDRLAIRGPLHGMNIPCRYFERSANWLLNQVLLGGLRYMLGVTHDPALRRRVNRLIALLGDIDLNGRLTSTQLDQAERGLTRMTDASRSALILIRLLMDSMGAHLEDDDGSLRTPGFLFDMNLFFEALLSRFFADHLSDNEMVDQRPIRDLYYYSTGGNPKGRRAPRPRPDFALIRNGRAVALLDAKYRDIWERSYPASWLYQLSIYAQSCSSRTSVLLYPTTSDLPKDERIQIRSPISGVASEATVVFRPVPLAQIDKLVSESSVAAYAARAGLARRLASIHSASVEA